VFFGEQTTFKVTFHYITDMARNIDRILTAAQPSKDDALYYKDYGLLLAETHVLRQVAKGVLPGQVYREFLVDVQELIDIKMGVTRQKNVIRRMQWGYSKWL
jgi:nuclear control of ATPase protein 2